MKQIYWFLILFVFLLTLTFQPLNACSINISPLRKEFRAANAVFVGKVLKIEDYYTPTEREKKEIPDDWTSGSMKDLKIFSKVTFAVQNKWKGNLSGKKEYVAVAYWSCGCPGVELDRFNVDVEYLIFASRKNFITVCDSFREKIEDKAKLIKKLDSFWFRTWARIYPF